MSKCKDIRGTMAMKVYEVNRVYPDGGHGASLYLTEIGVANLCVNAAGGGYTEQQTMNAMACNSMLLKAGPEFCEPVHVRDNISLRARLVAEDLVFPIGTSVVDPKDLEGLI